MKERPSVDEKSFELAKHFLEPTATEDEEWDLAAAIQGAVEDWFSARVATARALDE